MQINTNIIEWWLKAWLRLPRSSESAEKKGEERGVVRELGVKGEQETYHEYRKQETARKYDAIEAKKKKKEHFKEEVQSNATEKNIEDEGWT